MIIKMWNKRYAKCVSMTEALRILEVQRDDINTILYKFNMIS